MKRTRTSGRGARTPPHAGPALHPEQAAARARILGAPGRSFFITGDAGTGKTVLFQAVIRALRESPDGPGLYVTATTGIAAVDLDEGRARTLDAFAGTGYDERTAEALAAEILAGADRKWRAIRARWQRARTLCVDEISMLGAAAMDKLDAMARILRPRAKNLPFGGLRLLLCGDFLQLGCITKGAVAKDAPRFAFESAAWRALGIQVIMLRHQHRQPGDDGYPAMLSEIRVGRLSEATKRALQARVVDSSEHEQPPSPATTALAEWSRQEQPIVSIMPHRVDVDALNRAALDKLPGPTRTYVGEEVVRFEADRWKLKDVRAPLRLELRLGAPVMLVRNSEWRWADLVPTASGETGLADSASEEDDDEEKRLYLPNGAMGKVTAFGQEGEPAVWVQFVGVPVPIKLRAVDFSVDEEQAAAVRDRPLTPAVRGRQQAPILDLTGEPGAAPPAAREERVCVASRTQIPLMLASAMTGHKSQGQTITGPVVTDLAKVFEPGQAYVILSRVRTLSQLALRDLDLDKIRADPRAVAYYEALAAAAR